MAPEKRDNSFNKGYARIAISANDSSYSTFDGDNWDFCFVAPLKGESKTDAGIHEHVKAVEEKIRVVGFDSKQYMSVQGDEVYLLVRAEEAHLRVLADKFNIDLEAKPDVIDKMSSRMEELFSIPNFRIPTKASLAGEGIDTSNLMENYDHMWLPFRNEDQYKDLYVTHTREGTNETTLFTSAQRIKLIVQLLSASLSEGGVGMDDDKVAKLGWTSFPLHTKNERDVLAKCWLNSCKVWVGWLQPLDSSNGAEFNMKDYLGEQVTLYFAFLGTHCRWLFVLGLIGGSVQYDVYVKGNPESIVVALFALVVAIWAAIYTECWKRREALLALKWGMSKFESTEQVRLRFKKSNPHKTHSVVTGQMDYRVPNVKERARRMLFSYGCIIIAVVCIVVINIWLYAFKLKWKESPNPLIAANYSTLFSIALSVTISVVNSTYIMVAEKLTELENHRTETQFNDSKITKLVACLLISSFGSLAYAAFLEEQLEGSCGEVRCMPYLTKLVCTILIERLMYTMMFDNIIPRLKANMRFKTETKGVDAAAFSDPEFEFILDPFDNRAEIIGRYMDQVLMFGYMVLFVSAFPLAPFIGYISNILQIHQYGQALLFRKRRNVPTGAQDIGSFQSCFELMSTLAMVSNSGLVFFTMRDAFFEKDTPTRIIIWLFFGTIGMIKVLISCIHAMIPDESEMVTIQLERTDFVKRRLIDLSHEDEDLSDSEDDNSTDGIDMPDHPVSSAQLHNMI